MSTNKDQVSEDLAKKLNDMFGDLFNKGCGGITIEGEPGDINCESEVCEPELAPPLERAVEKALYALGEIAVYGTYGRSDACVREAQEALEFIKEMHALAFPDRVEKAEEDPDAGEGFE